ncbi:MAG TPA: prolipoprotein diacylglyceryl transferase [Phycisphaerales bacterium]|nr:prolipoprotein diacylglyceryl transferase [Phycisphaerales bacterium]
MLHTLDPFVLEFAPGWGVRWYGLSYVAGFVVGWLLLRWLARRGLAMVPTDRVADAMLWIVGGVLVGGRLGYVLFYKPEYLWTLDAGFPWWAALAINRGGMASHGGMIGVILAAWRISRGWRDDDGSIRGRCPPLHVMDLMALIAPAGLFFGRVANFINGELPGRVVATPGEPAPWWSVKFPQEIVGGHESFRTREQEEAVDAIVSRYMLPGEDFGSGFERMMRALRRGGEESDRLAAELTPLISARAPSQLLQALCEGVVVGALIWTIGVAMARLRSPGVVGAWFLISYGVLRIATEFVRLPDADLAVQRVLGLSRGQWLSAAMVVAGVVVLVSVRFRGRKPA